LILEGTKHNNHFLILRNIAAICIVFTHSFNLSGNSLKEPLYHATNHKYDFSFYGLTIFFTISGYLIAKSASTSISLKNYLWKRLLRIQPLLIVVTILCVVLGVFFSKLNAASYFTNYHTYTYLRNIIPVLGIQFNLPGVFTNNISESGVNGSLWTLVVEERLYLVMLLFWVFKKNRIIVFLPLVVALNVVHGFNYLQPTSNLLRNFDTTQIFYSTIFLNAAFFYVAKINFACNAKIYAAISFALLVIGVYLPSLTFLSIAVLPFFIIALAHCRFKTIPFFNGADYTYGVYIFSFPIQQVLCYKKNTITNPYFVFITTLAIVLPLAILSWHFFEQKILSYKNSVK
jgi:peptidoglycan/LPS O-acetylase OafA/YrhL